jgi:D-sedoheptulose 7-phosphate isomerase
MTELSLNRYFDEISGLLRSVELFQQLNKSRALIEDMKINGGRIILAGNGGSAGIVAHAAVDFTKQAKIPATTFNEPGLITAFSNDYGYELWVQKAFEFYAQPHDVLILVSVSGMSKNLVNAANYALKKGHKVITFTGKKNTNTLRQLGDINFWVNSSAYNIVEGLHMIWLTTIVDMIIGKSVYDVS